MIYVDAMRCVHVQNCMCFLGCSKINVGEEYQAELGDCDETKTGVEQDKDFSELVFMPLDNLNRDDEDTCKYYRVSLL